MKQELSGTTIPLRRQNVSWVNFVTGVVDRLPLIGPVWYGLAAMLALALFAVNDWLALGRPLEALRPFHIVLALEPVYALGLMHLLDERASHAFKRMHPLVNPPEAYDALHQQLVTLPARTTLTASLVGMALGLGAVLLARISLPAAFQPFLSEGSARSFVEVWLVLTWFVFGALFWHTLHQLREINLIYVHRTIIDLDHYQPLFHFSKVSGLTAVGLIIIPYAWYLAVPNLVLEPMGLLFGALFPLFAAAAFLWPLVGIHNLMVEAKGQALLENAAVLKGLRERLVSHATTDTLGGAPDLSDALVAIRGEREALLRVPTWPWQPGTPRSVAIALLLPLVLWFLQMALQRVLGA
jgi:hypothetical protein